MDIAISASSRIRECGTRSAEAATLGVILSFILNAFEDRGNGDLKTGKHCGVFEGLVLFEFLRLAVRVKDANHSLFGEHGPDRLTAVSEVKFDLRFQVSGGFR